jgi:hypothetical protein
MQRQGGFLRHVLRACYSERPFLERALDRYLRFLLLWRDTPGLVVVPMYDIDLMWHAHMAHSGLYRRDMQAFNAGKVGAWKAAGPAERLASPVSKQLFFLFLNSASASSSFPSSFVLLL